MTKSLVYILVVLNLVACAPDSKSVSQNATNSPAIDLGKTGNTEVAENFNAYSHDGAKCKAGGIGPKVLLTGFASFEGGAANVSGSLIEYLAQLTKPRGLHAQDHGAFATNRAIIINGHAVQVCLLEVQVSWDLAGAIIAFEMQSFQPDFVFMTGPGAYSVIYESGAQNLGSHLSGTDPGGFDDSTNTPIDLTIIPGAPKILKMTWSNIEIKNATNKFVTNLGAQIETPKVVRPDNDYVCNNVSYIALAAAQGIKLSLAGGDVMLTPQFAHPPIAGFMHIPMSWDISTFKFEAWASVLSAVIQQVLNL